jgi:hypothetical protein
MRLPNDVILAEDANGIDIILGGHDHNYVCEHVTQKTQSTDIFYLISFRV